MNIKNLFCPNKMTRVASRKISYIVIHYTAGTSSKTGSAKSTAEYFKNSVTEASADFCIDDTEIYQCNPDLNKYYSWAVGGYKYSTMTTSLGGTLYGKCTNQNSISIEICSNKTNKKSLGSNDKDWYFTESELQLAADLTKYLMKIYNIGVDNVVMHHHVTGKICPNPFCVTQDHLKYWYSFKKRLIEKESDDEMVDTMNIRINGKDLKINRILKDGKNYIEVSGLTKAGFDVSFDNKTKLVTVDNTIQELNLTVDGRETSVEAINIDGHNFCPIRSISSATKAFEVDWKDNKVVITSKQ